MTDQAFVRQEVVDASIFDPSDLRCPKCNGNTLVLTGQAQLPQREIRENGETVDRQTRPENEGSFDIDRIDCLPCNNTYLLRSPKLYLLEAENLSLKYKVADLERALEDRGGSSGTPVVGYLN